MKFDVAVVGGGISGMYCAWRLKQERPNWKIGLFEMSNRIGGRLLSVTPPGMPHVRCELGGMRYTTAQSYIRGLVETRLGLKTRAFVGAQADNIAYLRQKHLRFKDLNDPKKIPYTLSQAERSRPGLNPDALLHYAIEQLVPGATTTHGDDLFELLQEAEFDEKPLHMHGFWNLLARSISSEAYRYIFDSSGYDTIGLNWNALNTILLNFRDFGQEYRAVVDGYEAVPRQMCAEFKKATRKEEHSGVYLKQPLKSFDQHPQGGIRLVFDPEKKPKIAEARADRLILAMPRRALELMDETGPVLNKKNERIRKLIRSVTPVPLFKMFVCYPGPWWRAAGVSKGQSVTDLPLRQCYYWAVEGEQPGADAKNRNAVMLATYDDSRYVRFWAALKKKGDDDTVPGYTDGDTSTPAAEQAKWNQYLASPAMAHEIDRQLREMHGLKFAPAYYSAVYKNWGVNPYGGGVNFWKIGVKSWEVMEEMIQPNPRLRVYVCGEAYSNSQGWVEGALETAEEVLRRIGLDKPDWVKN
jgi:monoamine oxidase